MKERKKQLFCWRCNKPLSSLTYPEFEHQLCTECLEDDFVIKLRLGCDKELLIHKHRDGRTCKTCCKLNSDKSYYAEEPDLIARRKKVNIPDDSIFRMIRPSPTNIR